MSSVADTLNDLTPDACYDSDIPDNLAKDMSFSPWHFYDTTVLSCQHLTMVPATNAHRKDLIEQIEKLKAGGTTELESFETAFKLLDSMHRTGCQSIITFATDGKDTDGEDVRCGPGYYTRSGYVPGPICKYNFTSVYGVAMEKNKKLLPNIFRRSQEPTNRSQIGESYYNLLKLYDSPLLKQKLPGVLERIQVKYKEEKYPGLRVTYEHSTIFLAPQAHCDPIEYFYNDSLDKKTLDAHLWINGREPDKGCESRRQLYNRGVRFVRHFVWSLSLDLSDMGDPTSSCATVGIALGVIGTQKPLYLVKVDARQRGAEEGTWYLNLKSGTGSAGKGSMDNPDCTMSLDSQIFLDMFSGKANATTSFLAGKLKITGDVAAAMKLEKLMKKLTSKL